ncbi:MAG: type II secretion system protein GspL [Woeseiaceae bacterium]|nr:type II secretion system protein GspL [Woeseiaceae bacterium]
MPEYLVIRLGDDRNDAAEWIVADSSGTRLGDPAQGPLADARVAMADREVIALVPSAEVLTTTVDIPVRSSAKLQAALPFALEEYLADDIDNLHFAAGSKRESGKIPVSVVAHRQLQEWLDRLAQAGIEASSIVADSYGLARIPGTISMLVDGERIFVNDGADLEFVMEDVTPAQALAAIGALDGGDAAQADDSESSTLPRHLLVYCEESDQQRFEHDWLAIREELESLDIRLLADGVLPRLAVTVATGTGVNLLQGKYGTRKEYSGLFRPWKYAAMLLLVFGVLAIAAKATDYFMLLREEAELKSRFNADYREVLPGAPQTDDPARVIDSLRRRAGTATTTPVFLQSMQQLSRALQQNRDAKVEVISYRNGVVDIRLSAPDVGTLASIQELVSENGRFTANIQSTNQEGDRVQGRIQIQEVGS